MKTIRHPKACRLSAQRPGIIDSFIQPTALKHQVRTKVGKTPVQFQVAGKTLAGGPQWTAKVMRPGLAVAAIVPKDATPIVKSEVKPLEAAKDAAKAANAAAGLGRYYRF